jgi:hypothetical protein
VRESVRDLVYAAGPGPWDPPVRLRPYRVKTSASRTLFKLAWVQDAQASAGKETSRGPKT